MAEYFKHLQNTVGKLEGNVQVDETMWCHHTFDYQILDPTKHDKHVWIFGLIEESTHVFKVFHVTNRTTETLQELIVKHCKTGTNIHSDGWAAYKAINWREIGMTHFRHVKKP